MKGSIFALAVLVSLSSAGIITGMLASHDEGPVITNSQANPVKVMPGESLAITVEVADSLGISSAVVEFPYEGGSDKVDMILIAGAGNKHTYQAVWLSHDTLNQKWYNTTVTVTDTIGKQAVAQVPWQDPTQGHDASSIRAGTFSAGNYAFPNNLTVGGTNLFVDNSTGNVGIGTASPAEKLAVSGNISITGTGNGIKFPDGTNQTTAAGDCGTGFTNVGTYCIQTDEAGTATWWDAADYCRDNYGARLCSVSEWYGACINDLLTNGIDDYEWTDNWLIDSAEEFGSGSCSTESNAVPGASNAFRCCK